MITNHLRTDREIQSWIDELTEAEVREAHTLVTLEVDRIQRQITERAGDDPDTVRWRDAAGRAYNAKSAIQRRLRSTLFARETLPDNSMHYAVRVIALLQRYLTCGLQDVIKLDEETTKTLEDMPERYRRLLAETVVKSGEELRGGTNAKPVTLTLGTPPGEDTGRG